MPSEEKHLNQYNKNKALVTSSEFCAVKCKHLDWAITIIFYCALHLIEKEFAKSLNYHSKDHKKRDFAMVKLPKLKPIASEFTTLSIQSRRARYDCIDFKQQDIDVAIGYLNNIEEVVLQSK